MAGNTANSDSAFANTNPEDGANTHLTSGCPLARNTVWNLAGSVLTLIVAVACIPILIKRFGEERFVMLTLVWALVGFAGLFYVGFGRALTQVMARNVRLTG